MADLLWSELRLPQQKIIEDGGREIPFPAVLAPNPEAELDLAAFTASLRGGANRARVDELLESTGAVLLRGFPVSTASEFNDVVEAFGYEDFPYVGGAATRNKVVGRVYTANEAPPDQPIPFHHELTFMPSFPTKILFFCEVEPASGGETPIVPSHLVYEKMAAKYPDLVRQIEEIGLLSTYFLAEEDNYSSFIGRSWQSIYSTTDKSIAEERAGRLGRKLEWMEGGGAKHVMGPFPGTRIDERRGRKVWMNGLALSSTYASSKCGEGSGCGSSMNAVTLGDGTPVPDGVVGEILRVHEEACAAVPWEKGDVLLLDNWSVIHSRRPFRPPRRILASFGK